MPNQTTSDFDIVVQLSEELLDRYMILQYFSDSSWQRMETTLVVPQVIQATLNFNILIPSLSLHVTRPANTDTQLRIILPFNGGMHVTHFLDPLLVGYFYPTGTIFINTSLTQSGPDNNPSLDIVFSALVQEDVQVILSDTDLPPAIADGLEQVISMMVLQALQARKPMHFFNPQLGTPAGIVSLEVRTNNTVVNGDPTCLSLFMMTTKFASGNIPVNFVQFLKDDYSVAISDRFYNVLKPIAINQALKLQLFDTFPIKLPDDDSVTVNSADLVLQNGYLEFTASLTKAVGAINIDIDASAEVRLDPNFKPLISNLSVDLPWWIDIVNALLPWIGTCIYLIIKAVVERMIGDKVGKTTPLANISIFTGFLQVGNLTGAFPAEVTNYGCDISTDGFVLHGDVKLFTYVGNRRSKEIHVFNDKTWLSAMTGNYETYMERYEEYVANGYNGCYYCLRQLNTG